MDSSRKFRLNPADEERCVWMTAGIVDYQLCQRMFDCENCPQDSAIRRRFPARPGGVESAAEATAPIRTRELPREGYLYSRNHWWLRGTGTEWMRLGIETDLARALLGLKAVVFPSPQQYVHQGQTCVWVVMDRTTVPLQAPIGGIVRAVNRGLIDNPHWLCSQPFDDGWLCEFEVDDAKAGIGKLMACDEAVERFRTDRSRFHASLGRAPRGRRRAAGVTLADGGEPLKNYVDILGPARFVSLVRTVFGGTRR